VALRVIRRSGAVEIQGEPFEGQRAQLLRVLVRLFQQDEAQGRLSDDHRTMSQGDLANELGVEAPSLRRLIREIRDLLKEHGIGSQAVLERVDSGGYRLIPDVVVLLR
jgi:hypothetical protein